MACANPTQLCELCPKASREDAEMYCLSCKVNICVCCLIVHKNTPMLKEHMYISCDAVDKVKGGLDKKKLVKLLYEKISKLEKGSQEKDKLSPAEVSKIFAGRSGLEEMLEHVEISGTAINVRCWRGSFKDIMGKIQHVKTVDNLPSFPYRIALVNDDIWLRSGNHYNSISVYNKDLVKMNEFRNKQVSFIYAVQQVTNHNVMVASDQGLYLYNTEGECLYMIMEGAFDDVQTDGHQVVAVNSTQNKIVYLGEKDNKWQQQQQLFVEDEKNVYNKPMCVLQDQLYVSFITRHAQFMYHFISGLDDRGHRIVCDAFNNHFQLLDPESGNCELVSVEGIQAPNDVLTAHDSVYVIHKNKLSKYSINNLK